MLSVNKYRSHTCGELSEKEIGKMARVAGWVDTIRDHGGVLFIDIRDQYGTVQLVLKDDTMLDGISKECVISAYGKVVLRDEETINPKISTGTIEIRVEEIAVLGKVTSPLPFEVSSSPQTKEEVRLKYRYLDLRNKKVHDNIVKRSQIIRFLRNKMADLGFLEIQTPILTA